jgi:hypothetical protein
MLTLSLRIAAVSRYPLPPSANREAVDGNILTDFSGWVGDALKILLVSGSVSAARELHVCVLAACVMAPQPLLLATTAAAAHAQYAAVT